MTQSDVAGKTGMPQLTIARIEGGDTLASETCDREENSEGAGCEIDNQTAAEKDGIVKGYYGKGKK